MSFKIVSDSSSDLYTLSGIDYESAPLKIITDQKEYVDDTNLDDYLGKPGLQVLKALAQIGGTAAGGYGGFKAGERLWLG